MGYLGSGDGGSGHLVAGDKMTRAVYIPTGEVVTVQQVRGNFTRVGFNSSSQFVATGCLRALPEPVIPVKVAAAPPKARSKGKKPADTVSLFLREMEDEADLRTVCSSIGVELPVRASFGLTKMAVGHLLRKAVKAGEYTLEW